MIEEKPKPETFDDDILFRLPGDPAAPGGERKPQNNILTIVLDLLAEGISTIPLKARSKEPAIASWKEYQKRLPTEAELHGWFIDPSLNYAIICGPVSGNLVGFDFDTMKPAKDFGKTYASLLAGAPVVKPSRGYHLYVRTDVPVASCTRDGYEIRSTGCYLVGAGSTHPSGKKYELVKGDMSKIPVIEAELLGLTVGDGDHGRRPEGWQDPLLKNVPEGERHTRMVELCGRWYGKGLGEPEVLVAAQGVNARWRSPLPDKELAEIVRTLKQTHNRKHQPVDPAVQGLEFTDMANALRFSREYGDRVRYCTLVKSWFYWNGKVWAEDDNQVIASWAKITAKELYEQAWALNDAEIARKAIACKNRSKIEAMLALSKSEEGMPVRPSELDTDPWLWNCSNGMMDLKNIGFLLPHEKEKLITRISPVSFDDGAKCPKWDAFLLEVMAGDQGMVDFLRRMIGYCLTGDMRERKYFTLFGIGNNGKTVFIETVMEVFGDYAATALRDTFLRRKSENVQHDIARLRGARLVCVSETGKGSYLDEELVKQWTGQDTLSGRFLYAKKAFDFKPVGKLLIRTNYRPNITGQDEGIWGRSLFIEFPERFEGEREDKELKNKLFAELPGIFRWCLVGCAEWQSQGLDPPKKIQAAGESYREDSDDLADFFAEYLVIDPDARIENKRLYTLYLAWCEQTGEKKPKTSAWLGRELSNRGFKRNRNSSTRGWLGIGEK